jgi:hypothetical protein
MISKNRNFLAIVFLQLVRVEPSYLGKKRNPMHRNFETI